MRNFLKGIDLTKYRSNHNHEAFKEMQNRLYNDILSQLKSVQNQEIILNYSPKIEMKNSDSYQINIPYRPNNYLNWKNSDLLQNQFMENSIKNIYRVKVLHGPSKHFLFDTTSSSSEENYTSYFNNNLRNVGAKVFNQKPFIKEVILVKR